MGKLPESGTARCEAEIGSVAKGWHTCNRRAAFRSWREFQGSTYSLHFCQRHERKARAANCPSIRVTRVEEITK